tara:strand:+ start:1320 stop:2678 length:1359 start_codon:yes stop_codon:yes gene_type:complete
MEDVKSFQKSEMKILDMLGLTGGGQSIHNKVMDGTFRKVIQSIYPTTTTVNYGSVVQFLINASNVMISELKIGFQLPAQAADIAYKELYNQIEYIELKLGNAIVEKFYPEQLFYEMFLDNALNTDDLLVKQEEVGLYAYSNATTTTTGGYSSTIPPSLDNKSQNSNWWYLTLPNVRRLIQYPASSYVGKWMISVKMRPYTEVLRLNGAAVYPGAFGISDSIVYLVGYDMPRKELEDANRIISRGFPTKYVWPIVQKFTMPTAGPVGETSVTFPSIRGRLTSLVFWFQHKSVMDSVVADQSTSIAIAENHLANQTMHFGTVANPYLFTFDQKPMSLLLNESTFRGVYPLLLNNSVIAASYPEFDTALNYNWKKSKLAIYEWNLSDSLAAAYETAISNGSANIQNDIRLTFSTVPINTELVCLFYIRKEIKFSSAGVNAQTSLTELKPLQTETR